MGLSEIESIQVSVVIPCLNEADTLATCIRKANDGLRRCGLQGEVVVADNGSADGSVQIATREGARVVHVPAPGYGNAVMAGIEAARGRLVIMGDADDSYDFLEIPKFVSKLLTGAELVQGCRLPAGGGSIQPGAMPFLHRWLGNPLLTLLARLWFQAPIHDIYCGLRGFTSELYRRLDLRCTGMEFATEMIIKASLNQVRIEEVPITLHPDGRKTHPSHLNTFRDGWRTLRFFLLFSPRWLFLLPGIALIAVGVVGYALALPGITLGGVTFDAHTLLFASLAILCGYQSVLFSILTKTFAINEGLLPFDSRVAWFYGMASLERGLIFSAAIGFCGLALLLIAVEIWRETGFGALDYPVTMRFVVPGALLTVLGFQTSLFSFYLSLLTMKRKYRG